MSNDDNKTPQSEDCLWCGKILDDCTCIVDAIRRFDGMFGAVNDPRKLMQDNMDSKKD